MAKAAWMVFQAALVVCSQLVANVEACWLLGMCR